MKIQFYALIVKDTYGNKDATVCNEMCDDVYLCGIKNKNGEFTSFNDEAKHLKTWCNEVGVEYEQKTMVIDV